MSGDLLLDWAALAVSLYNAQTLLWLGLIVLLSAERRHLGIWLAGGGLLCAAAFFLSHSAILGFGFLNHPAIDFWWHTGWIPVILSPYAWYVVMLWYAGFWESGPGLAPAGLLPPQPESRRSASAFTRRHRPWPWLLGLAALGFVGLFLFTNPLPSFRQALAYDLHASPSLGGGPALFLLYPLYIVACIGLSLDALVRPGPTVRMMGPAARRRAHPWLAAAAGMLLLVSLLVAGILWAALALGPTRLGRLTIGAVVLADLMIDALIAAAITMTGQAIVAYEVFTGKSLPRGGLQRAWRRTLILSAGLGAAAALSLTLQLPAIYTLLVSIVLAGVFYALLVWRSYSEREHFMRQLRPFVAGMQSYRRLLDGEPAQTGGGQPAFAAVCTQVLGASWGTLAARGAVRALFGAPWVYPPGAAWVEAPEALEARFSPQTLCLPIEQAAAGEAAWAVPLWNEQGCCGVLLLGEKTGGAVYTQEEIETARAVCERLVDAQAGEEAARRLLGLQRRQLAESQALDRRARRALHDDILPQIHAALLAVSRVAPAEDAAGQGAVREAQTLLTEAHRRIADLLRDAPGALTPETARQGLAQALRRVVEQELQGAFDHVSWRIEPAAEQAAAQLPSLAAEAMFYAAREAVRNVARHARPAGSDAKLHLQISMVWKDGLALCIEDNGVGMREARSENSGSGQGMLLHATLLALAGGELIIEDAPATGARVRLWLPA